jgi:outer membrane protein
MNPRNRLHRGTLVVAREVLSSRASMRPFARFSSWLFWVSTVASLAAGPAARADEAAAIDAPAPTRSMTMAEALAYARDHQPAIRAALARVAARAAEAEIPSGQWLPTVGVTAQVFGMTANNTTGTYEQPSFLDLPRIGATPATTAGTWSPYPSTLVGAGVLQEVFDFGRIGAKRAAADAIIDVARHSADAVELDVDFGVEEAFFAVLAAKSVVTASEDAYERAHIHRDLAQAGVRSGLRSPIELTRAEADLAHFDIGRVRARGGLAVAQSVLAAAMGAPDPAIDVSGGAPKPAEMPALPEAVRLAEARDPALAAALAELEAAERRTRAVGAELRPDLSFTATLSGRAGGARPNGDALPTGDGWVPDVPNWDVGLLLGWPIFDGTVAARRNAALADEGVRRSTIDVEREQAVARVRQTYVSAQVARSTLTALAGAVVAAHANYDQADARFRAGIGNAVELADAEAVRTDAEIQLALGQFELARTRAAFGRAIAEGL